jgi:hypothetical protein
MEKTGGSPDRAVMEAAGIELPPSLEDYEDAKPIDKILDEMNSEGPPLLDRYNYMMKVSFDEAIRNATERLNNSVDDILENDKE